MCRLVQIVIFKEEATKLVSAEILSENLHHETWPVPCPTTRWDRFFKLLKLRGANALSFSYLASSSALLRKNAFFLLDPLSGDIPPQLSCP